MGRLNVAFPRGLDDNGAAASGAKLYVYNAGTSTPVTTYSDVGLTTPNASPLVADASGEFTPVYLPDGDYKVKITDSDDVTLYESDNVVQSTLPASASVYTLSTVAALVADTKLKYSASAGKYKVTAGDYVEAGGFRYKVAGSGASDENLTTAGGVKLYVQPFGNCYLPEQFNADDTGGTGAASIINDMLALCASEKRVALFRGTYLCDAQLTLPTGIVMQGAGRTQAILKKGFNGDLIQYASQFVIRDITLDGNKATYTGDMMVAPSSDTNIRTIEMTNVEIKDFAGDGCTWKEPGQAIFQNCRWVDGDGDAIVEDTYGGVAPFGDDPRYFQYQSCEVRSCRNAVYSISGARHSEYDIRIQQCTEHAYKIEGTHFMNRYANTIGTNNGSAFYVAASGALNRAVIMAQMGSNLVSPPAGDYSGTEAEMYFADTTTSNAAVLTMLGATFGTMTGIAVKSLGIRVRLTNINCSMGNGTADGNVYVLDTDALSSPSFDWSTVQAAIAFDFANAGTLPRSIIDRSSGHETFLERKRRALFSTNTTLNRWEVFVVANAFSSAFTITLPPAADCEGLADDIVIIKDDSSANAVTIDGDGAETINGAATIALSSQWDAVRLRSDGTEWYRVP